MKKKFNDIQDHIICTKNIKEINPVMEQFNLYAKQGLLCSIDLDDECVPKGAVDFFNRHGYLIMKNLCDAKEIKKNISNFRRKNKLKNLNLTYIKYQSEIGKILQDLFEKEIISAGYCEKITFIDNEIVNDYKQNEYEFSVNLQISSNLNSPFRLYLQSLLGQKNYINHQDDLGILLNDKKIDIWSDKIETKYNSIEKFIRKIFLMPDNTYQHQVIFYYR